MVASTNGYAATSELPRLLRLGDLLAEWERDAIDAHDARVHNKPRGPITGLKSLDRELGAALAPGLHVVHGGPGVGKSAFALQVAATCGCPAAYISCEMAPLELFRRHTARTSGTFLGRLRSGELAPEDSVELAQRAARAAPDLAIIDATHAFASPAWIAQAVEGLRGQSAHLLVIVDSVHSWAESSASGLSEYEGINSSLGALRALAATLGCAVIGIAERNRASMVSGGLSASAGSRRFEYQGESVLDLSRDDKAIPTTAGEVPVSLVIQKNRNGSPGKNIPLLFHGALQQFREADKK